MSAEVACSSGPVFCRHIEGVEAIQWTGNNFAEVEEFVRGIDDCITVSLPRSNGTIFLDGDDARLRVRRDYWLVSHGDDDGTVEVLEHSRFHQKFIIMDKTQERLRDAAGELRAALEEATQIVERGHYDMAFNGGHDDALVLAARRWREVIAKAEGGAA